MSEKALREALQLIAAHSTNERDIEIAVAALAAEPPEQADEQRGTCDHKGPVAKQPHAKMQSCVNWKPLAQPATKQPSASPKPRLGLNQSTTAEELCGPKWPSASQEFDALEAFDKWLEGTERRYSSSLNPRNVFIAGYAAGKREDR